MNKVKYAKKCINLIKIQKKKITFVTKQNNAKYGKIFEKNIQKDSRIRILVR